MSILTHDFWTASGIAIDLNFGLIEIKESEDKLSLNIKMQAINIDGKVLLEKTLDTR